MSLIYLFLSFICLLLETITMEIESNLKTIIIEMYKKYLFSLSEINSMKIRNTWVKS